jgi:SNF2 family DNA or RNA helicase
LYESFQRAIHCDDHIIENHWLQVIKNRAPRNVIRSGNQTFHTFQILKYLNLLCVHPALIVRDEHHHYKNDLIDDERSSGKLMALTRILVDSGVIQEGEYDKTAMDSLYEVECPSVTSNSIESASSSTEKSDSDEEEYSVRSDHHDGNENDISEVVKKVRRTNTMSAKLSGKSIRDNKHNRPQRASLRNDVEQLLKKQKRIRKEIQSIVDEKTVKASPDSSCDKKPTEVIHRCLIFAQHRATLDVIERVRQLSKVICHCECNLGIHSVF